LTDRLALAFLGTFESLRMGPTFARGRRDERAGHVRHLTISGSLVVAQVRGPDDPKAFRSRIAVRAFGAAEWARVEQDLAAEARYAADLLAGRTPADIGAVFAAAGLSLVPLSLDEVAMDCTCERWPMPCVHLAATGYALARTFSEDPFGVFAWRGRSRDELLMHLRDLRSALAVEATGAGSRAPGRSAGAASATGAGAGRSASPAGTVSRDPGAGPEGVSGDHRSGAGGAADAAARDRGSGAGGSAGAASGDRRSGAGGFAEAADAVAEPDGDAQVDDWAFFWGAGAPPPMVPTGGRPGAATRPDALLDQLDPPPLAQDGRRITDLLRPAYQALPEE
jgi:uncharacterized Zn finger protein